VNVAHEVGELENVPRAVALGTFDGVHLGHRRVLERALEAAPELRPTVVTFSPHPRSVLGNRVELLTTLERRLELIADTGVADTFVVEFTAGVAATDPASFAESLLRPIGTVRAVAGQGFRFGSGRAGDLALLERLGFEVAPVEPVEGVSSTAIRELLRAGDVAAAAAALGRAPEVDGIVVAGDARGGTLGFPTANLRTEPELLVPANGIYAGAALGRRTATSIGTNPHYGGTERRIEAFLLDFAGDLYGERLVVELWQRLRDERAFASEEELVAQITRDVEEARAAEPPV
jgi:riboflavin kinase / FMN adenylyltransferase